MKYPILFFLLLSLCCFACDKNEHPTAPVNQSDSILVIGTGAFNYQSYLPLKSKPVKVWYHIPANSAINSDLLIVFTGAGRDAKESRDEMISLANKKGLMVFVPEFSDSLYPGSNQYNLGNVFINGDNPSNASLNNESDWTFSIIDPLYDYIKLLTGHAANEYDIFGHSAGAQFVHRFVYFKPNARIRRAVASSAGWYTMPDTAVKFPYGLALAPSTDLQINKYLSFQLDICVGQQDTDPNSAALRHTAQADLQGMNRVERAAYFFNESKTIAANRATPFQWKYHVIPNAAHDFKLTSSYAVNLLYP